MADPSKIRSQGEAVSTEMGLSLARVGLGIVTAYLLLAPLLFCLYTIDAFEECKLALLLTTSVVLIALALWHLASHSGVLATGWFTFLPRAWQALQRDWLLLGFVLFTLSAILSTLLSVSPRTSWRGAIESYAGLKTVFAYLVLFLGVRSLCRHPADRRRLLLALVTAMALVGVYALLQFAQWDPIIWSGLSVFAGQARPISTLGHPNLLAAYLVLCLPILAMLTLSAVHNRRWVAAAMLALVILLACVVVVLALSRAAWASAGCALLVLLVGWWYAGARRTVLLLTGSCVLVGATLVLWLAVQHPGAEGNTTLASSLTDRVQNLADGGGRWHLWQAAWALFQERPIAGWGLDTFRMVFGNARPPEYGLVEWDGSPTRAHNEILHTLATQGAVGGLALIVVLTGLVQASLRAWRISAPMDSPNEGELPTPSKESTDRLLVVAVIASLVAFCVQALLGFTVIGTGSLFCVFAALLSAWSLPAEEKESPGVRHPHSSPFTMLGFLVGGTFLALLVFGLNLNPQLWHPDFTANLTLTAPLRSDVSAWLTLLLLTSVSCLSILAVWRVEVAQTPERAGSNIPPGKQTSLEIPAPAALAGILRVGVIVGTLAVLVTGVLYPLRASLACRMGMGLADNHPQSALQMYEKALEYDPDASFIWMQRSGALQLQARLVATPEEQHQIFEQAQQALERAVGLVPADPFVHANLGRLCGEMSSCGFCPPARALAEWELALKLDPNNPTFLAEAARTALAVEERERASVYARRGARLYPHAGSFGGLLGTCALLEGNLEQASTHLGSAIEADWRGDAEAQTRAIVAYAASLLGQKKWVEASRYAWIARNRQPDWALTRYLFAQALESRHYWKRALREYTRVLEIAPQHAGARKRLSWLREVLQR